MVNIFREHNKEADVWTGKVVKGREEEWIDAANVVWSEVVGVCGFRDDSCDKAFVVLRC